MKKIRVISLIERGQIKIEASPLQIVGKDESNLREYYSIAGNLIEFYDFSNEKLMQEENWTFFPVDQTIILVDEWNSKIESFINPHLQDALVITHYAQSTPSCFETVIELLDDLIDLNLLVWLLEDKSLQFALKNGQSLLIGKEREEGIVSHIVLNTLKQINRIQVCEQLKLYLFSKDEFSLTDLALIEDPIHDYLDYQKFQIEQSQQHYSFNDICYALVFNK